MLKLFTRIDLMKSYDIKVSLIFILTPQINFKLS